MWYQYKISPLGSLRAQAAESDEQAARPDDEDHVQLEAGRTLPADMHARKEVSYVFELGIGLNVMVAILHFSSLTRYWNTNTPQIVYRVAICPRENLPYIQIISIVLPYSQSTNYLLGTYLS